jgi:hypothetical protein
VTSIPNVGADRGERARVERRQLGEASKNRSIPDGVKSTRIRAGSLGRGRSSLMAGEDPIAANGVD